ncbi:MAG TPA: type II toxin-antitoxin system MqsA family antitoxin [Longimicrobium sp.]|jgi:putative zinc finger/helix-turn-helix YgiT family protein|nr:type II toxin-antitoxin system MqsA family antitoxin [Longimicrobium sp.]
MSDLPKADRCPVCGGEAHLTREVRPITILARSVAVEDEFYRCTRCREEVYRPGMMDAVMRRATAKIREEDGLLTPDEVRAVRRKFGLTQPEFERLLGVGANTVVRWERGTVPQGSAADSLLRLLDEFTENARFLAGLHGVELPANGRRARTKAA